MASQGGGAVLPADVASLLERLNSAFPPLGTEVTDAVEARRRFEALRRPPARPTAIGEVSEEEIDGPDRNPVRLRRYEPAAGSRAETVLFMHGGGWVLGGLDSHDELVRKLVAASGATIVSVDYRLAPEHPFPAGLRDCYAALSHLAAGTDAPLVVAGDSAGGNLAAAVALVARDRGGPPIRRQVLLYPMLDDSADSDSYRVNADGYYITAAHLRWFWQQYLPDPGAAADPYAAPLRADARGLPPALVVVGGLDPLREDGLAFAARLAAAGVPTTVQRYPEAFHGFLAFDDEIEVARRGLRRVCEGLTETAGEGGS